MEIYVAFNGLERAYLDCRMLMGQLQDIQSSFRSITSTLDWDVKSKENIQKYINNLNEELSDAHRTIGKYASFFQYAKEEYFDTETAIEAAAERLNNSLFGSNNSGSSSSPIFNALNLGVSALTGIYSTLAVLLNRYMGGLGSLAAFGLSAGGSVFSNLINGAYNLGNVFNFRNGSGTAILRRDLSGRITLRTVSRTSTGYTVGNININYNVRTVQSNYQYRRNGNTYSEVRANLAANISIDGVFTTAASLLAASGTTAMPSVGALPEPVAVSTTRINSQVSTEMEYVGERWNNISSGIPESGYSNDFAARYRRGSSVSAISAIV